ncbi:hypothetical protein ACWD25_20595, partial [Streptomyces sp. NPDC002920]
MPTSPSASLTAAAAKPRVEVHPPYAYTLGAEACDLAKNPAGTGSPTAADVPWSATYEAENAALT